MKLSNGFFITRKEYPNDEESISGKLLVKSGMIYKNDIGTYTYLPMGFKVLENIKKIIREEHYKSNIEEVMMPTLITDNMFKERLDLFDKDIFRFIDRNGNHLCLCPTSEELFALIAGLKIKSYKDLHFSLFQIGNKYRDEYKSKNALLRKKEFIMSDTYSFDSNESGLSISYDNMYHIYSKIFKRLNIDFFVAESNPGFMLGTYSEEFHSVCDYGEDEIVKCTSCTYTANRQIAAVSRKKCVEQYDKLKYEKIYTPNIKSINDLVKYLNVDEKIIIKSLIYKADEEYKLILMSGNDLVSEVKLNNLLKAQNLRLATDEEIEKIGGEIGYVGPLKATMEVIADYNVKTIVNGICGSNEKNYHIKNVTPNMDFRVDKYYDLKLITEKDLCPICKNKINIFNTIEIANIFKLGTIYSDIFKLKYIDEKNKYNRVYMGSYGIGIDRCISAIVERNHDENGIIWPMDVAPYKVSIVIANVLDRDASRYANELYNKLISLGIDTVLDDRKVSIGVKLKDVDLIGIPIRITVGYKVSDNIVEIKLRNEKEIKEINKVELINYIKELVYDE